MQDDTLYKSIKSALGVNYNEKNEDSKQYIIDAIEDYKLIASNESNCKKDDSLLIPYIKEAVISAYLRRGKEGNSSNSEGGISDTYIDIADKLRKDVKSVRVLP